MPRWMTGINVKDLGQAVKKKTNKTGQQQNKTKPSKEK